MKLITLENKRDSKLINDIIMYPLKVNRDTSGILIESLRKDWTEIYGEDREFSMQYLSVTDPGIARDENVWHYHPTVQEDRFLVAYGDIVTAVADNRKDSSTNGLLNLFYMKSDQNPYILLIPKKTLHGFLVVSRSPAVLLNFPTALYNPKEEKRVLYQDASIMTEDNQLFNWDLARKQFPALSSK